MNEPLKMLATATALLNLMTFFNISVFAVTLTNIYTYNKCLYVNRASRFPLRELKKRDGHTSGTKTARCLNEFFYMPVVRNEFY